MSVLRRVLAWFREAFEAARPARDGRRSGGTMEIKRDRMVFLGYGKYWRSDAIVGLMPIEEERGPKRRTNVFVEGRAEPIVASRTEQSILEDMGATEGGFQVQALREAITELLAAFHEFSPCCGAPSSTSITSTSKSGSSGWARSCARRRPRSRSSRTSCSTDDRAPRRPSHRGVRRRVVRTPPRAVHALLHGDV